MKQNYLKIFIFPVMIFFIFYLSGNLYAQKSKKDSLKNIIENIKHSVGKSEQKIELAFILFLENKNDSAVLFVNSIGNNEKSLIKKKEIAEKLNNKSFLLRRKNKYFEAITFLNKALQLSVEANDSLLSCKIYNNIGIAYRRIDDDENASKNHQKALQYAMDLHDSKNMATALNSLGIINNLNGNHDVASEYFRRALEVETKRGNQKGIAMNYNTLAWVNHEQKRYKEAVKFYQKAINFNIKNNDLIGVAICKNDIGLVYVDIKEYDKAMLAFSEALTIFEKNSSLRNIANIKINLSELYYEKKNYSKSINLLNDALVVIKKLESKRLLLQCYENYAKTYKKMPAYSGKTIEYMQKVINYKDSIYNENSKKIIAEYEAKNKLTSYRQKIELLNTEKNANDKTIIRQRIIGAIIIFLLILLFIMISKFRRSNKILQRTKSDLENQNFEIKNQRNEITDHKILLEKQKKALEISNISKDKFFSIIAHDLRNPFNALLSLSGLLAEDYDDLEEAERREMVELIHKSADNGYRLLENLLIWSKSQSDGIKIFKENLDLHNIISDILLILNLKIKSKKINVISKINKNTMIFADLNMIKSIIQNLISNSLKFTPEGGEIIISSKFINENIVISISDTGIGIKKEVIRQLFRIDVNYNRKGTNHEAGSGLGLILCKEFVEKHGGKIFVKSMEGKGSIFYFTIPMSRNN